MGTTDVNHFEQCWKLRQSGHYVRAKNYNSTLLLVHSFFPNENANLSGRIFPFKYDRTFKCWCDVNKAAANLWAKYQNHQRRVVRCVSNILPNLSWREHISVTTEEHRFRMKDGIYSSLIFLAFPYSCQPSSKERSVQIFYLNKSTIATLQKYSITSKGCGFKPFLT